MPNFINLPPFTEDGDVHVVVETLPETEPDLRTTLKLESSIRASG
jgi:hypothetical protein